MMGFSKGVAAFAAVALAGSLVAVAPSAAYAADGGSDQSPRTPLLPK